MLLIPSKTAEQLAIFGTGLNKKLFLNTCIDSENTTGIPEETGMGSYFLTPFFNTCETTILSLTSNKNSFIFHDS